MSETLAPGEAARRTGLTLDALRYYEREGLIGPIGRTTGGTRRYTADDVAWVGTVTCLRDAGLGIDELRRFTALVRGEHDPAERVDFLRRRYAEMSDQLRRIEAAMEVLADKIAHFGG